MSKENVEKIYKVDMFNIRGFFKEHRFLSNFEPVLIEYDGILYTSTEAAYQSAKTNNHEIRRLFSGMSPTEARKEGQKILLRDDWKEVRNQVMIDVNRLKYEYPPLGKMLLLTGDRYLEETNWWGDEYWGVCNGKGSNVLGHILMKIRGELREKQLNKEI